jgi:hypothetical protein
VTDPEQQLKMDPAPTVRDAAPDPPELLQPEYPPDILPIYVAKLYDKSHTPGDPANYPPPPPPPSDTASGLDPIVPAEPVATLPPINVDVPHVSQDGDTLACTMGNWDNTPTSYAYAWQLDGSDASGTDDMLGVTSDDIGKTATCIVTATNAAGSTAAPPSIGLEIAAFT